LHDLVGGIAADTERGVGLWAGLLPASGLAFSACFIAESAAMGRLVAMVNQVMRTDATVLIEGDLRP
jgi:hypothetical protein